jgi:hypothetical protein
VATPGERRRDRERWSTIRVPMRLRKRIEALCQAETQRYTEGRTAAVAVSDRTEAVPAYALIESALDELDDKRKRSNRKRGAK